MKYARVETPWEGVRRVHFACDAFFDVPASEWDAVVGRMMRGAVDVQILYDDASGKREPDIVFSDARALACDGTWCTYSAGGLMLRLPASEKRTESPRRIDVIVS